MKRTSRPCLALLLAFGLSCHSASTAPPALGEGEQALTVVVHGVPPGMRLRVREDASSAADVHGAELALVERAPGVHWGSLRGTPRRFLRLQLQGERQGRASDLYGQLLIVPDRERHVVEFDLMGEGREARAHPRSQDLLGDPSLSAKLGQLRGATFLWGLLVLGVLSLLAFLSSRTLSLVRASRRSEARP